MNTISMNVSDRVRHGGTRSPNRVPTLGHGQKPRNSAELPSLLDGLEPCPTVSRADRMGVSPLVEGDTVTHGRSKCPECGARVITYDHDYHLDCYLGPTRLDPTPLTLNLAIACRLTSRPIYHHTRDRAGNRRLSRIWTRHPLPTTGHILPAHHCGATTPTHLPPIDRNTTPEHAPF